MVVFLHCDNCTGQNKNNCVLQYLAWRVMTGRHTQITLSFLVVGHTKFAPDWSFGLFKRLYRRTRVGSLQAIAKVANDSAQCNFPQLVTTEDGTTVVPTYDWTDYFAPHFRKFTSLKQYHHFRFVSSEPGVVYAKMHADTAEVKVVLVKDKWSPDPAEYPSVVTPKGLSVERQWYLYEKIREFCPEEDKDSTCPRPTVPQPGSRAGTPCSDTFLHPHSGTTITVPPSGNSSSPPRKMCGTCRKEGHNSRTCPDNKH